MATALAARGRLVLAVLAVSVAGCGTRAGHGTPAHTVSATATAGARPSVRVVTSLERPGSLATGPSGQLYIADDSRNQILQALPGGGFRVVAGNGKAGFSGDGGPAVAASLDDPGGMTVTPSGTLYFADTGNNRIRAVSPRGIISAVAGNGRYGSWVSAGTPARAAGLGGPADVVIGPGGRLYIADQGTSEILELSSSGQLFPVAGAPLHEGRPEAGAQAAKASTDGPEALAFDSSGNLFDAGSNTKTLIMISRTGIVSLPAGNDGFYPRGDGGLVAAADGSIMAMNGQEIDQITNGRVRTIFNLYGRIVGGVTGFMPNGIAVAENGGIYLDTWYGNGWADKTALIEIRPDGTARVIWES